MIAPPLYVYGIVAGEVRQDEPFGTGVGAAPVRPVSAAAFTALVSSAGGLSLEPTRRNMLAHTAVLERVLNWTTVLPMRFGTIAPSIEALSRCLDAHAASFTEALSHIEGRVELGVKISWAPDLIYAEVIEGDAGLRAERDRLRSGGLAQTYQARLELGRRVEEAVVRRRESEATRLLALLTPLAARAVSLRLLDPEMVLNHAFLVARPREAAFDAAMERLAEAEGARLRLRYVGPVPAYNFVSLRTDWLATA